MCKFELKVGEELKTCQYFQLGRSKGRMPIDKEGLCVLHSKNINWKAQNKFNDYIKNIIEYYEPKPKDNLILLEYISFIESVNEIFKDIVFKYEVSFNNSVFMEQLVIDGTYFNVGVSFKSARFEKNVEFKNVNSVRFEFDNAYFNNELLFSNCISSSNFFMTGVQLYGGLRIRNTVFSQCAFFDKMTIGKEEKEEGCSFHGCKRHQSPFNWEIWRGF
jgi:hypothetical protein